MPATALLLDGELAPANGDSRDWYFSYAVEVESYDYTGYPSTTMTLYPRLVCNTGDGCPDVVVPAASTLEVTSAYEDSCGQGVYDGSDISGYGDDVASAEVVDGYGASCGNIDQLTATLTHADGSTEQLVGYRTQ